LEYCYCAIQQYSCSEILGRSSELCNAMTQFIPISNALGYKRVTEYYCRQSMQMSENIDDQNATALSLMGRAIYMASTGQINAAIEMNIFASELFDNIGNIQSWNESIAMMIVCEQCLGNLTLVVELAERACDTCYKADNFTMIQWFTETKINALFALNRTKEVEELLVQRNIDGYVYKQAEGIMHEVSERSERASWKTRILAIDEVREMATDIMATSTKKLTHSIRLVAPSLLDAGVFHAGARAVVAARG